MLPTQFPVNPSYNSFVAYTPTKGSVNSDKTLSERPNLLFVTVIKSPSIRYGFPLDPGDAF